MIDQTVKKKKPPDGDFFITRGLGELDFVETSFSNSLTSDCQSAVTLANGSYKGDLLISELL